MKMYSYDSSPQDWPATKINEYPLVKLFSFLRLFQNFNTICDGRQHFKNHQIPENQTRGQWSSLLFLTPLMLTLRTNLICKQTLITFNNLFQPIVESDGDRKCKKKAWLAARLSKLDSQTMIWKTLLMKYCTKRVVFLVMQNTYDCNGQAISPAIHLGPDNSGLQTGSDRNQ